MYLRDRYLGSFVGGLWAILTPLSMLLLFTFVFGFVFKARLPGADTTLAYAIWLICGYGPWLAMNESLIASTNSIVSGSTLVKNIPMNTAMLPLAATLMGLVPLVVSLVFLFVLVVVDGNALTWHLVVLPVWIFLHFLFAAGVGFVLSSLNVFIRDVSQALPTLLMMMMFLTPIFYSIDMFPEPVRAVSEFNPIHVIVSGYRDIVLQGHFPSLLNTLYLLVLAPAVFAGGVVVFRRLKPYFDSRL